METTVIENDIEISPDKLDFKIKQHIYDELSKNIGICCKKYGYILEIINIISISNKSISNTSANIIFNVKYTANTLKPSIGNVISCKVNMVFIHGLFLGLHDLKVLIPSKELKNYKFDSKKNIYYGKRPIKKDDIIDVVIQDVKYMKKQYSCIGVLKE